MTVLYPVGDLAVVQRRLGFERRDRAKLTKLSTTSGGPPDTRPYLVWDETPFGRTLWAVAYEAAEGDDPIDSSDLKVAVISTRRPGTVVPGTFAETRRSSIFRPTTRREATGLGVGLLTGLLVAGCVAPVAWALTGGGASGVLWRITIVFAAVVVVTVSALGGMGWVRDRGSRYAWGFTGRDGRKWVRRVKLGVSPRLWADTVPDELLAAIARATQAAFAVEDLPRPAEYLLHAERSLHNIVYNLLRDPRLSEIPDLTVRCARLVDAGQALLDAAVDIEARGIARRELGGVGQADLDEEPRAARRSRLHRAWPAASYLPVSDTVDLAEQIRFQHEIEKDISDLTNPWGGDDPSGSP